MHIITRAEAKAAGQTTYFTGKPCSKGHIVARSVSNWGCLTCASEASKRHLSKKSKTPEYVAANRKRAREWQLNNPDRYRSNLKEWSEKNKEKKAQGDHRWRQENKERCVTNRKAWQVANPEKHRASRAARFHRRRIREIENGGSFTVADIMSLSRLQKDRCAECRKRRKALTVDHKVPLYLGGSNHRSNLQLLCLTCNSRKGRKDPIAWAQENGRLV